MNMSLRDHRSLGDCPEDPLRGIEVPKVSDVKSIFLVVLIITLLALTGGFAGAQQRTKVPRIGILGPASPSAPILRSFREGLRELGYVEGQNVILESRFSSDGSEYHRGLADEVVRLGVDVVVAFTAQPIVAAMKATKTIPIVMTFPGDAASEGFVASLERPGGNVTGVSGLVTELGGKWLELLKEAIPTVRRVAVLWNPRSEDRFPTWKGVELAARSLQVDVTWMEVRNQRDVARAFRPATYWGRTDAFIVLPGGIFGGNRSEIAGLALKSRLPGIFWRGDFADEGGLMAYGANRLEQSRRAAYVVDKILRGAKPADLPVERPTQFELVINLKTAKEIGVTIQPEVLMFADRVIK
jgi:putative ABC transport system substrate-binding protein